DGDAFSLHRGAETSSADDILNVGESPVGLGISADLYLESCAEEMVPFLPCDVEGVAFKGQALESFSQFFDRKTGINQSADQHVSADAGKAVQIGDFHSDT
ncbi:hypothetical protein LDC_1299, partial [sediment metagenome]